MEHCQCFFLISCFIPATIPFCSLLNRSWFFQDMAQQALIKGFGPSFNSPGERLIDRIG
jgi:hypothetical protein